MAAMCKDNGGNNPTTIWQAAVKAKMEGEIVVKLEDDESSVSSTETVIAATEARTRTLMVKPHSGCQGLVWQKIQEQLTQDNFALEELRPYRHVFGSKICLDELVAGYYPN